MEYTSSLQRAEKKIQILEGKIAKAKSVIAGLKIQILNKENAINNLKKDQARMKKHIVKCDIENVFIKKRVAQLFGYKGLKEIYAHAECPPSLNRDNLMEKVSRGGLQ